MRQLTKALALTVALMGYVLMNAGSAQAAVTWDEVKAKAKKANDYHVIYKYEGPKGQFDFDYAYAGDKIRTEILRSKSDPSRKGTVIIYDKGWATDKVRARVGGGMITRNLTHKDVEDTPFYQSIFDMIFAQVDKCGKPTASQEGSNTVFRFKCASGEYTITANANGEIIKTDRKDGRDHETREFISHKWNSSPKTGF